MARFNLPLPLENGSGQWASGHTGGDVCRASTADKGPQESSIQNRAREQSTLILDVTNSQAATILLSASIF